MNKKETLPGRSGVFSALSTGSETVKSRLEELSSHWKA